MIIGKDKSDEEAAEMLMRHRARTLPALIVLFLAVHVLNADEIVSNGIPDRSTMGSWLILSILLLGVVATGGGFVTRRPGIRAYIDDELSLSHRQRSFALAFWVMVLGGYLLMTISLWREVDMLLAVHSLIGSGVIAASARYTLLERRALRS